METSFFNTSSVNGNASGLRKKRPNNEKPVLPNMSFNVTHFNNPGPSNVGSPSKFGFHFQPETSVRDKVTDQLFDNYDQQREGCRSDSASGGSGSTLFGVTPRFQRSPWISQKVLKRKSSFNNSDTSPSRKQLITEEKMAASMKRLNLDNDHNYAGSGVVKQKSDDSDFEDDSDLEDVPDVPDNNRGPVIQFAPNVKDKFFHRENENNVLPKSILDNMRNNMCMAIVPYKPPDDLIMQLSHKFQTIQENEEKKTVVEEPAMDVLPSTSGEQFYILDWDSNSEDDLILD